MIIKLTEVMDGGAERELYVNVDHIETMWVSTEVGTVTILKMASDEFHWVRETPDQILDM